MGAELATLLRLARGIQSKQRILDRLYAIQSLPRLFEEIAERDKKSLTKLAQMGWFFGSTHGRI